MSTEIKTLERGNIYFLYRPRIGAEDPEELGDIQRLYMILSPAGKKRFRIAVIGRKRLPQSLQKLFGERRFAGAEPKLLDHPGMEFLLISAAHNVQDELDITLDADEETRYSADIFKELHLERNEQATKPLFEGRLV